MVANDWKSREYTNCKVTKKHSVSRTLYLDNLTTPKYKFKEIIHFTKDPLSDKHMAICIGINPAKAEQNIDPTNINLIKLLFDNYDGYILLNIYPEITKNAKKVNFKDDENINFTKNLDAIINENKTEDIILFFGRTTIVPSTFIELINSCVNNNRIVKITTHDGEFTHPARRSINLTDYSSDYVRSFIKITLKNIIK